MSPDENLCQLCMLWVDAISEIPSSRFYTRPSDAVTDVLERMRYAGLLDGNAELFDNTFFGVSPAEATSMEPLQRLLLEHGYTALHLAGLDKLLM